MLVYALVLCVTIFGDEVCMPISVYEDEGGCRAEVERQTSDWPPPPGMTLACRQFVFHRKGESL